MAFGAIDRLADELAVADVAVLTGDLTNFGDPPDAARVVAAVRRHCPSVLAVTGNLDMPWVIDALRVDARPQRGRGAGRGLRRGGRRRHAAHGRAAHGALRPMAGPFPAMHVDHVSIAVRAIAPTLARWQRLFPIRPRTPPRPGYDGDFRWTDFFLGDRKLELIESARPGSFVERFLAGYGQRWHHLSLDVEEGTLDRYPA